MVTALPQARLKGQTSWHGGRHPRSSSSPARAARSTWPTGTSWSSASSSTSTRRCAALSKGNRQKVQLIAALATRAELLILDEPTSGLDPLMEMA
jgi:ABC-type cobalamin/Fe3+-siderophores transport system ATPase subunit